MTAKTAGIEVVRHYRNPARIGESLGAVVIENRLSLLHPRACSARGPVESRFACVPIIGGLKALRLPRGFIPVRANAARWSVGCIKTL